MISFLITLLLGGVIVEATATNGETIRGQLISLSADGVLLKQLERSRNLSREQLKEVSFPAADTRIDVANSPMIVEFSDGSTTPAATLNWQNEQLEGRFEATQWKAPLTVVRSIRIRNSQDKNDQWDEILTKSDQEDLLVIRREENLDYLAGIVLGIDNDTIRFKYRDRDYPVPFTKAAGVILAKKNVEFPPARLRLTTMDGARWQLESARLEKTTLQLVSSAKVTLNLPLELIRSITFPETSAVYLADLEASNITLKPFFPSVQLRETLLGFMEPQVNRSFDGVALRVIDPTSLTGQRQFANGLAVQSKTELVYRLAGRFRQFRATIGLDPMAAPQGNVEFVVFADSTERLRKTVLAGEPAFDVEADVTNARRLRLLIDYGDNLDIGDRIHLGEARLTK